MNLKPEGGVTQISLDNARELIDDRGLPQVVQLINKGADTAEHCVVATWPNEFAHTFTGFSWGYHGEGPTGLSKFMEMIGLLNRISLQTISKLPQIKPGLILSFARDKWIIEFAFGGAGAVDSALAEIEGVTTREAD